LWIVRKMADVAHDQLLSTRQAAERTGKSVWTIARLVREGHLEPVLRVDGERGAMWFKAEDIEALADEVAS
jgi:hypothetical protein